MSEYDIAIKIAGQLEGSFKNAIKGAQSGLSGLGVSGKVGTLALKGIGVAAKATAAALAATGTAAVALGGYAVSVGKDFEAQMSTVQSISGATGDEFEALKAKAKEMGSTTSFSATEAGAAMEYMAMAGWKSEDMIEGIGGIMNLAAASGEDLALTSDIVTDALTAFGLSAKDSGHFADVLAAASSNANTNVAMLGESFQYAAPVAGALGISAEDTSVALGLMANAGIKASSAGTALRTGLTNLAKPTKQMQQYMDRYNIAMVKNEDGSINLRDTMIDLRQKMNGLSESEQAAAAAAIFGKNSMAGWLAIVNSSDEDFNKLAGAIDNCNGKAEEMAAIKLDNLEGDITLLKSAAEGFGISLYENMQGPMREWVQFGKDQIGILQEALDSGGFEGLASAIGDVLANGVVKIGDAAPDFINGAADIVEALIDGIDGKSPELGAAMARLGTALLNAAIRLIPRMIVTGGKLMVEFAKGMVDNLPALKEAGTEAVAYFWQAIKSAFGSYKDFLGDEEVEPFKKVLALLPALVAGFAVFDGIGGSIKGFVTAFKGAGKAVPGAAKGIGGAGKTMSAVAKNILGVGAGFALAAAGIWLLVNAAERISQAGPGAAVALVAMVGGIVALMAIASKLGPELQASQQGLIAFGAAMLMTAAAMAIMSYAAIQLANAGPLAFASLALMIGGMAGMMAIAGAFGTQLATAAPGLIAFGAAILLAAAGMAIMTYCAITLTNAGTGAIAMFAGLAIGLIAFMAVAALLGPMLVTGGAGMLLLGAGLLVAAAAMALMANTAIMLSNAGTGAIVMLVALVAIILAFGAAAGALAPLLMAGGAALAVFGAGLLVVSAAAAVAAAALLIISLALPSLSQYGASGAVAILELGAAMGVFAAGAVAAGAGAGAAALGFGGLALAAAAADLAFAPLALEMTAVAAAVAIIGASSSAAASGLTTMKGSTDGMVIAMGKLALAFAPVTLAIVPYAAAVVAGTAATVALAASIGATTLTLVAMAAALAAVLLALAGINLAITTFRTQAVVLGTSTLIATMAFTRFGAAVAPMSASLTQIVAPMTRAGAASVVLATGMTKSVGSARQMAVALAALAVASAAGSAAFRSLLTNISQNMTQAQAETQTKTMAMVSIIRMGGTQIMMIATMTANGVRQAFSIDLTSSGQNMMQGLINGMNSMAAQVQATATRIANQAAQAVNNALQIHSPSQLMVESGQYTGEGLAIGMQNRTSDVQTAAMAMTQPIQDQSQQMRDMSAPQTESRSGVIGETIDNLAGGTTNNNTTTNQTSSPTFNFNPTYVIEGNADQETIQEANKMSQADFEKMMNEWMRTNKRVQFA